LVGAPSRNDADDLWLTISIDHHQQIRETTQAQRDEALLTFTIRVFARQCEIILSNGDRFGDTDPMGGKVRCCFGGVPFILHVLNVWTMVFFVKDGESRIERIAGKG
jgi:hypothetical protein